jgi:hypothetical protein
MMAEMSIMRTAFARMEEREVAASTARASGSKSGSSNTHALNLAPNGPSVAPLPNKKALITITMIREYMGLPEDKKDDPKRPNDQRWSKIRVSLFLKSPIFR